MLRERLKHICRRTLRKDVQEAGHINYTRRIPATFKFEPHDNEVRLYNALSDYLKRKDTIAFGEKPWRYLLIPHDAMLANATLAGLGSKFTQPEIVEEMTLACRP